VPSTSISEQPSTSGDTVAFDPPLASQRGAGRAAAARAGDEQAADSPALHDPALTTGLSPIIEGGTPDSSWRQPSKLARIGSSGAKHQAASHGLPPRASSHVSPSPEALLRLRPAGAWDDQADRVQASFEDGGAEDGGGCSADSGTQAAARPASRQLPAPSSSPPLPSSQCDVDPAAAAALAQHIEYCQWFMSMVREGVQRLSQLSEPGPSCSSPASRQQQQQRGQQRSGPPAAGRQPADPSSPDAAVAGTRQACDGEGARQQPAEPRGFGSPLQPAKQLFSSPGDGGAAAQSQLPPTQRAAQRGAEAARQRSRQAEPAGAGAASMVRTPLTERPLNSPSQQLPLHPHAAQPTAMCISPSPAQLAAQHHLPQVGPAAATHCLDCQMPATTPWMFELGGGGVLRPPGAAGDHSRRERGRGLVPDEPAAPLDAGHVRGQGGSHPTAAGAARHGAPVPSAR
jgi:hypothetical protein